MTNALPAMPMIAMAKLEFAYGKTAASREDAS